jgi:hypothetical protein
MLGGVGANERLVVLARPPQVSTYGTVTVSAEGRGRGMLRWVRMVG